MARFTLPRAALRRTLGAWSIALVAACTGSVPAPTTVPATTGPTTGPTIGIAVTPKPTPLERAFAPSFTIWGDWIAEVPAIPEMAMPAGLIQLSIDWQEGKQIWLQATPDGRQVLWSSSLRAGHQQLRVRSDANNTNCPPNSEGRYSWSRSTDGLFLNLTLIEDACPARGAVFARTWVHSHGAVNDGGLGVNYGFEPKIQMALPRDEGQRWAMGGGVEAATELKTFGSDPFRAFVVVRNPGGFSEPCAATSASKVALDASTTAFATYVEGLPNTTVERSSVEVGGRPGIRLDVQIGATTCMADGFRAFRPENVADDYEWWFEPGEHQPLYIVQMDADTTFLLWYQGPAGEEESVIGSISFIDHLPTP